MVSLSALDTHDSSANNNNNNNISIGGNHSHVEGKSLNATSGLDPTSLVPVTVGIQIEEIIIVAIIIVLWVVAVVAFRRKWDSIRIMQPVEPRYKHIPKNLDSVKVVKRAQDSVIYKSYSRKMSTTMVARENRHLQRTHTMPCMNSLPSFQAIHSPSKRLKQTLPTIHMEEATTESEM